MPGGGPYSSRWDSLSNVSSELLPVSRVRKAFHPSWSWAASRRRCRRSRRSRCASYASTCRSRCASRASSCLRALACKPASKRNCAVIDRVTGRLLFKADRSMLVGTFMFTSKMFMVYCCNGLNVKTKPTTCITQDFWNFYSHCSTKRGRINYIKYPPKRLSPSANRKARKDKSQGRCRTVVFYQSNVDSDLAHMV